METINKIAENNVEISEIKEITETQSYGQDRIDNEREILNAELSRINAFDKIAEAEKIDLKLQRLDRIQSEMNKQNI